MEKGLCKFTFYVLFSHLFTNSIDNFAKFVYNTNTIQYAASKATKGLQIKKTKNTLRTLLALLLLLSLFLVSVSALPAVVSGSETAGTVDAVINAASTRVCDSFFRRPRRPSEKLFNRRLRIHHVHPFALWLRHPLRRNRRADGGLLRESALPPYPVAHLKDFYYGGPLNYFILENGVFHELYTQQSLTARISRLSRRWMSRCAAQRFGFPVLAHCGHWTFRRNPSLPSMKFKPIILPV